MINQSLLIIGIIMLIMGLVGCHIGSNNYIDKLEEISNIAIAISIAILFIGWNYKDLENACLEYGQEIVNVYEDYEIMIENNPLAHTTKDTQTKKRTK